jgi:hypothetical protein
MKHITSLILGMGLLALTACNPAAKSAPGGAIVTKAGDAKVVAAAPQAAPQVSEVKLASGQSVKVVQVAALDTNPSRFAGQVAIAGKVETVYADRGTFTLVDCAKMAGCKDNCCSKTAIPMSVPQDKFEGALPEANQEVIVIGTLTPAETGYSFDVQEVRVGAETVMKPKAELPATQA